MSWKLNVAFGLLCVGCGPSTPAAEDSGSTGEDTSSTGEVDSTGTTPLTTSGSTGSTGPSLDDTGTDTGPDDTTGDTGTSDSTGDPTTGDPTDGTTGDTGTDSEGSSSSGDGSGLLPDGAQCSSDDECINDCYEVGALGGICGECDEDADCPGGGCSLPNPVTAEPSYCNLGELGGGCETSAACGPGLECAEVLSVPGIFDSSTCSECLDDTDCPGQTCQPSYDVPNLSGVLLCVDLDSLPDGAGCDLDTGDAACMSGVCATADFMMLLQLGVCSECNDDTDCPGGTCQPAEIDLGMGLVPGVCV